MSLSNINSSFFHPTDLCGRSKQSMRALDIAPVASPSSSQVYSVREQSPRHTIFTSYSATDQRESKRSSPLSMFKTSPNSSFSREPAEILFYHSHKPYYGFTNFSNHPVVYQGKKYPTSEHLFQSFKFRNHKPDLAEHIRTCSERPSVAFSEARRFQPEVRSDWKEINISIMDFVLRLKFEQHDDLREELLGTGYASLVEDSDKDAFWGVGPDRKGRNELGKALQRLRNKLRTSSQVFITPTYDSQSTMTSPISNALHRFEYPVQTVQSPSHNVNAHSPAVHTVRLSPNTRSQVDPTKSSTQDTVQSPANTSPRAGHNVLPLSHVSQSPIQSSPHLVQPVPSLIQNNQAPTHNAHVPVQNTQVPILKVQAPEQDRPLTEQKSSQADHSFKRPNYNLTESISTDLAIKCRIPHCEQPVYYDGTTKSDYCSQEHRQEAVRRNLVPPCIKCLKMPQSETDYFCGRGCREESLDKARSKV